MWEGRKLGRLVVALCIVVTASCTTCRGERLRGPYLSPVSVACEDGGTHNCADPEVDEGNEEEGPVESGLPAPGILITNDSSSYDLGMDEARLIVDATPLSANVSLSIALQNSNCWKCRMLTEVFNTSELTTTTFLLYANHSTVVSVRNVTTDETLCSLTQLVSEHGSYRLLLNDTGSCHMVTEDDGGDAFLPILYGALALLGLIVIAIVLKVAYRRGCFDRPLSALDFTSDRLVNSDLGSTYSVAEDTKKTKKARFKSVDAFRGLSLCIMIFVNNGGGGYWFFNHSEWNGLTLADLVFPWFVFIMGTVLPVVYKPSYWDSHSRLKGLLNILIRSARLFVLGLMVNTVDVGNDLSTLRISGVLQRFSITFLVVASFDVVFSNCFRVDLENPRFAAFADLLRAVPHLCMVVLLLVLHATVSLTVPYNYGDFANCSVGYLGPAGLQAPHEKANCTGGIARYIDTKVLGYDHYYAHPTCKNMYHCASFDPEGILGYLTSIALCFLGLQAGVILVSYQRPQSRCLRWFGWAVVWGVLAMILTLCSQNDGFIPINKNLWSVSFVSAMAATANMLLLILHLVIDVYKLWGGAPFIYPGMNSIVVYVGSEILHNLVPVSFAVSQTHIAKLFMALWSTAFWVLAAAYMHYKGIFISV